MSEHTPATWDAKRIQQYLIRVVDRLAESVRTDEATLSHRLDSRDLSARRLAEGRDPGYSEPSEIRAAVEDLMHGWPNMNLQDIHRVIELMPNSYLPAMFPWSMEVDHLWEYSEDLALSFDAESEIRGGPILGRSELERKCTSLIEETQRFIVRTRDLADQIASRPLVLHKDDLKILGHLSTQAATVTQYDLVVATELSRNTISDRLSRLRAMGYVWRPNGPRGGEAITEQGKRAIQSESH